MDIYQVKIQLKGSRPAIWRRLLVQSNLKLSSFHDVIQIAMGWTDSHLHQFTKDRIHYTVRMKDDFFWDDSYSKDYKAMKISDLMKMVKEKIVYEYDFGDGWEHEILLEKISPNDQNLKHPVCLGGKINCPPEDCGGIWGYQNMLMILKQPDNEEYEEMVEWIGEDFDPEYFDADEVNESLKSIRLSYIKE